MPDPSPPPRASHRGRHVFVLLECADEERVPSTHGLERQATDSGSTHPHFRVPQVGVTPTSPPLVGYGRHAAARAVPAQEEPDQTRLAGVRWTHDRYVSPRLNTESGSGGAGRTAARERSVRENAVATGEILT
jgi:hypothetical protein